VSWLAAVSGNFHDGTRWSGGNPPGAGDNAIFNNGAGPYSVQFDSTVLGPSVSNARLLIPNDRVLMSASPAVVTYNLTDAVNPSVVIGSGAGTSTLRLTDLALVSNAAIIAQNSGSTGTVDVLLPGASWNLGASQLTIGQGGQGLLNLEAGGTVIGGPAVLGQNGGSKGEAIVDSSSWTAGGLLQVGLSGTGRIDVQNMGALQSNSAAVGGSTSGSTGSGSGTVRVKHLGSTWSIVNQLRVGDGGTGSVLVDLGGEVTAASAIIGNGNGGSGTVEVFDQNSLFTVSGAAEIASTGSSFGSLKVQADGRAVLGSATVGKSTGAVGDISVTGGSAQLTVNGHLQLGVEAQSEGTLGIIGGGTVHSGSARLGGDGLGGTGRGLALVVGAASLWQIANELEVGHGGAASLAISGGGHVQVSGGSAYIGRSSNDPPALMTAIVGDDPDFATFGGQFDINQTLHVGYGAFGGLLVQQGGSVSSANGTVGTTPGGMGIAQIGVPDSIGAQWTLSGSLYIGGDSGGPAGTGDVFVLPNSTLSGGGSITAWSTGTLTLYGGTITAGSVDLVGGKLSGYGAISSPASSAGGTVEVLAESEVLTLSGSFNHAAMTKTGLGRLVLSGPQTWNAAAADSVVGGTLRYELDGADAVSVGAGATLTVGPGATLELAGSRSALSDGVNHVSIVNNSLVSVKVSGTNQSVGGISGAGNTIVLSGADLTASHIRQNWLSIQGNGRVIIRPDGGNVGASRVETLTMAGAARLNLADNDLVIGTANLADIRALIVSGYNGGGWDGNGIYSDAIFAGRHGLGYAAGNDPNLAASLGGMLSGQSYDADSVLVKYTWLGDADLDGTSGLADLGLLLSNYNQSGGWTSGDFNYDGAVNFADLGLLLGNYGGSALSAGLDAEAMNLLASYGFHVFSVVPEPGTALSMALAGLMLGLRRRAPHKQVA